MPRILWFPILIALGLVAFLQGSRVDGQKADEGSWTAVFPVTPGELSATGRNPYFILEPGYRLVLAGGNVRLTVTVLDETRTVDGVKTRVVEERETKDGQLIEVARNYFAISKRTNNVFYFGEEVHMYRDGKLLNHSGTWLAGVQDAKFGLLMPGRPVVKARHYQELAPGVAMDRAEIVSVTETVQTPAGEFTNVLKVQETTPLQPLITEYKYYAPGVGLVQDGALRLVEYGQVTTPKR